MQKKPFKLEQLDDSSSLTSETAQKVNCNRKQKVKCTNSNNTTEYFIDAHLQKAYECENCEAKFTTSTRLKRHQTEVHTGIRPFECCICAAKFANTSHLKRHIFVHTGERPYKCDTCQATFTQPGILKTHYLVHTKERPFKCGVCEAAFTTLGSLKTHHIIHTGLKPHACHLCEATFSRRDYLKKHVLTHREKKNINANIKNTATNRLGLRCNKNSGKESE